jgi:hypothetical protein
MRVLSVRCQSTLMHDYASAFSFGMYTYCLLPLLDGAGKTIANLPSCTPLNVLCTLNDTGLQNWSRS